MTLQKSKEHDKILSPFLSTAPLRYAPKIQFTQAIFDCLTTNKTKNVHNDKTVILNHVGGDSISHSLRKEPFVNVLYTKKGDKIWPGNAPKLSWTWSIPTAFYDIQTMVHFALRHFITAQRPINEDEQER